MVKKYDSECEICKIFSNPSRLSILINLGKKSLTVTEIIKKTKLPQSVISQHLAMMRLRKIVETEKKGSFTNYKIKYPEILDAFKIMIKINKKIQSKS